jgi:hypothetical protein
MAKREGKTTQKEKTEGTKKKNYTSIWQKALCDASEGPVYQLYTHYPIFSPRLLEDSAG